MIWPDDTIVRSGLQQVTPGHPANKYAGLAAMVKCQVSEDAHSNQPCWLTVASDCGDGLSMMLLCQLRRADASRLANGADRAEIDSKLDNVGRTKEASESVAKLTDTTTSIDSSAIET